MVNGQIRYLVVGNSGLAIPIKNVNSPGRSLCCCCCQSHSKRACSPELAWASFSKNMLSTGTELQKLILFKYDSFIRPIDPNLNYYRRSSYDKYLSNGG